MTTLRTFIAVELSHEAITALAELQKKLKGRAPRDTVRWTAPESIHLTLHFLGNIDESEVETVTGILVASSAAYPHFSLSLSGLGCFPNFHRPRIVWVGVSGDTAPLAGLQHDLGRELQAIGYTPENRPYSPHLTVGRVKDRLPGSQLAELGQALQQLRVGHLARLDITGISLMKSELKPAGAVYTQLAFAPLGA